MGCPLLVALGDQRNLHRLDVSPSSFTRRIAYLEDGGIAVLSANGIDKLIDKTGAKPTQSQSIRVVARFAELGPLATSCKITAAAHRRPAEVFARRRLRTENFT